MYEQNDDKNEEAERTKTMKTLKTKNLEETYHPIYNHREGKSVRNNFRKAQPSPSTFSTARATQPINASLHASHQSESNQPRNHSDSINHTVQMSFLNGIKQQHDSVRD